MADPIEILIPVRRRHSTTRAALETIVTLKQQWGYAEDEDLILIRRANTARRYFSRSALMLPGSVFTPMLDCTAAEIVANFQGDDVDFRVQSDNNANMLFVNGGTDGVGIDTTLPTRIFTVGGANDTPVASFNRDTLTWTANQRAAFGVNDGEAATFSLVQNAVGGLYQSYYSQGDATRPNAVFQALNETDPTTTGAFRFACFLHDGAGGVTTMGNNALLWQLNNNVTNILTVMGNGNFGVGVDDPDTRTEILYPGDQLKLSFDGVDNCTFAVDTAGAMTVTPSGGSIILASDLTINTIAHEGADVDTFLVSNAGLVNYRTGAEVLGDIGGATAAHLHDTQTLQNDGVNSDGGAFAFTTSGAITFSQSLILPADGAIGVTDGNPQIVFDNGNNWLEITGRVGIGVADPDTQLEVLFAGDQLKLSFDGTDYCTFAVDTAGDMTITPSGGDIILANGTGLNLYEDITFLGALNENLILFPDELEFALILGEGANQYQKFVSTVNKESVWFDVHLKLQEQTAAIASSAGYGQIWMDDADTVTVPKFTDDAANDYSIAVSDHGVGGAGSAGAGNQYIEIMVGVNTYKCLHDGTV
jgi:hypothetical protein